MVVFNWVGEGLFRLMEIERTSLIEREQRRKTSLKTTTSSCMPWINALGVYMKKYTMHSKLIDEIYPVKEYGKERIPALVRYNNVREERATKRFLKKIFRRSRFRDIQKSAKSANFEWSCDLDRWWEFSRTQKRTYTKIS